MMEQTEKKIEKVLSEISENCSKTSLKSTTEVIDILLGSTSHKSIENDTIMENTIRNESNVVFDLPELMKWRDNNNNIYELQTNWQIRSHRKWFGGLIVFGKKVIRKFLHWYIDPIAEQQNAINGSFTASVNALTNNEIVTQDFIIQTKKQMTEMMTQLERINESISVCDYKERINSVEQKNKSEIENMGVLFESRFIELQENIKQHLEQQKDFYNQQLEKMQNDTINHFNTLELGLEDKINDIESKDTINQFKEELFETKKYTENLEKNILNLKECVEEQFDYLQFKLAQSQKSAILNLIEENITLNMDKKIVQEDILDNLDSKIDYFKFENHFRGKRKQIKRNQEMYLPYFLAKKNVLDLGCGRGEFLELLKENHINATGIDLYKDFVEYCQYKSFNVVECDAIYYLKELENNSIDGIFSAQLVEHLSSEQIIKLCNLAYQKLQNDCYLIIETPNPASLAIYMNSFYLDPSHEKPIHAKAMEYFLKEAGFKEVDILYTEQSKVDYRLPLLKGESIENLSDFNDGINFLSDIIFGSQDYAVIAKK